MSSEQAYSFLSLMDANAYDKVKASFDSSATFPIPGLGGLFSGTGNFDAFREKRDALLKQVQESSHFKINESHTNYFTSEVAYEAWSKCKRDCVVTRFGFDAWKEHETDKHLIIQMFFKNERRLAHVEVSGHVTGGSVAQLPKGELLPEGFKLPNGDGHAITIQRSHKAGNLSDILVTINVKGYDDVIIESNWRPITTLGDATLTIYDRDGKTVSTENFVLAQKQAFLVVLPKNCKGDLRHRTKAGGGGFPVQPKTSDGVISLSSSREGPVADYYVYIPN
jgi:hypothetical protein